MQRGVRTLVGCGQAVTLGKLGREWQLLLHFLFRIKNILECLLQVISSVWWSILLQQPWPSRPWVRFIQLLGGRGSAGHRLLSRVAHPWSPGATRPLGHFQGVPHWQQPLRGQWDICQTWPNSIRIGSPFTPPPDRVHNLFASVGVCGFLSSWHS